MVTDDTAIAKLRSTPPRVSKKALQHRRYLAICALKKYETALRFTDDVVHGHLAQNLRARLNYEQGTCQSFWMSKLRAQASEGCTLLDMAQEAFELVTEFRSVEAAMSMPEYSQEARMTLYDYASKYGSETHLLADDELTPVPTPPVSRNNSLPSTTSFELWAQNKTQSVPLIALDYEDKSLHNDPDSTNPRIDSRSRDLLSLPTSTYSRIMADKQNKRLKRIHPPMLEGNARSSAENAYVAYHSQLCGSGSAKRARLELTTKSTR